LPKGANLNVRYAVFFNQLLVPLYRFKLFPQHRIFEHVWPMLVAQCERQIITPLQNISKLYFSISQFLNFWTANWKTKDSWPNGSRRSLKSVCY